VVISALLTLLPPRRHAELDTAAIHHLLHQLVGARAGVVGHLLDLAYGQPAG
jgi:hypothetical protein